MKKTILSSVLAAAAVLSAVDTFAARPDYNYLEGGYLRHRLDDGCVQDGIEIGASLEVSDRVFVAGNFSDVEGEKNDFCGSTMLRGGVGLFGDFSANSTFYGSASILNFDPDFGESDMGWGLEAGFRSYIARGLEGHASVGLIDAGDLNEVYISAGGIFWFTDVLGAYLDLSISDESTKGIALGGRFSFKGLTFMQCPGLISVNPWAFYLRIICGLVCLLCNRYPKFRS